ncbi:MAG: hypothetical protein WD696_11675 [Bryobacteraceae bacterium]
MRSEGLAEKIGDILLNCAGGSPGAAISGSLILSLPAAVTNRISSANAADAVLTVDTGGGAAANGTAQLGSSNSLAFNGINFTVPPSGAATIRISNVRVAANQLPIGQLIPATLALTNLPGLTLTASQVNAGTPTRGLAVARQTSGARLGPSPLPETFSITGLLGAGTRSLSTRLTEGFLDAFQKKDATSDTGVRFRIRYTGLPAGTRLFLPDAIAGSNAATPTSSGEFGSPTAGGSYTSGSGALLLSLVRFPDPAGSGGTLALPAPNPGTTALNSVTEVAVADGSATAVYEVMEASGLVNESAQIPAFYTLSSGSGAAGQEIRFAPLSTVTAASTTAPVPRFVDVEPEFDCATVGDCTAPHFPRLRVDTTPIEYSATAGSGFQADYVTVNNAGGGALVWNATVAYTKGTPGWLQLAPASGVNNRTVRADAHPGTLAPGSYEATITVNAEAPAGSATVPVKLTILPPGIVVRSIGSAARSEAGRPLSPGSLASIFGSGLAGQNVVVTFDSVPARLLFVSESQINVLIPLVPGSRPTAELVVTVDGAKSAATPVSLAEFAPAIFGILNQNNTLNDAANPASAGSVIQVFATGLAGAAITARIHDRAILSPHYAGPAPGLDGVQQINLPVPGDLPDMTANVVVCAGNVCSTAAPVVIATRK